MLYLPVAVDLMIALVLSVAWFCVYPGLPLPSIVTVPLEPNTDANRSMDVSFIGWGVREKREELTQLIGCGRPTEYTTKH